MIYSGVSHKLRIHGIVEESIVDGPGLRFVIFTQGCEHACPHCHNPETHSLLGGHEVEVDELFAQFIKNPLLAGITFSGGEPFLQAEALAFLGEKVRTHHKSIVVYSGYTIEELVKRSLLDIHVKKLLEQIDILIDGPYIQKLRELDCGLKGSANQQVLDRKMIQKVLSTFSL